MTQFRRRINTLRADILGDHPNVVRWFLLHCRRRVSFERKMTWDLFSRPHFAYGIHQAAVQAKALAMDAMSVIEFGVAGGKGLLAMEDIAAQVEQAVGIRIDVYGFDTGTGQPPAKDYRDSPYIWREGQFRIDEAALRSRLQRAKLVIGDVGTTVPGFFQKHQPAPLGFISWDMDYYSSTKRALSLFNEAEEGFLPRMFCYFDDIVGDDAELHCEWTGELLAIQEFNKEHPGMKLARISGLPYKRRVQADWHVKLHVLHRFDHPRYNDFINHRENWQLPL